MHLITIVQLILTFVQINGHLHLDWEVRNPALNQSLYEDVLDSVECQKQIGLLQNNTFLLSLFLDAGIRIPRGLLAGNTIDLGNYHQCLEINQTVHNTDIEGKYCMIRVPLNQELPLQTISSSSHFDPFSLHLDENIITKIKYYELSRAGLKALFGADLNEIRSGPGNPLEFSVLRLAVCIPKPCTTEEALSGLLFNMTALGFKYEDDFCRLPDDKPWVPADFTAFKYSNLVNKNLFTIVYFQGIFSLIGLLSFMSTYYELNHIFARNRDPKSANKIFCMFSVYSNTRRLLTFTSSSGALECIDGVRALAMLWVLLGHSFSSQPFTYNAIESFQWILSYEGLWITAGHITVDTFFMLSGLLVVYTTAGKLTSVGLLKNIHKFYLNRLLRMFPILATTALLEASVFNRISDGPVWNTIVSQTHRCRTFWWSTLLHVQNYVNSENVCIGATWYLAIDVQLHLLSPIILVWVLSGNKRIAWSAVTAGVVLSLTAATIYNFMKEFPTGMITAERGDEMMYYMVYYYMNTLTRAPPFLVGMVFGYLLHTCRGKPVFISTILNLTLWALSLSLLLLVCYCTYPTMQPGWDNQTVDSLINSFMRPAWALGLGWVIFACVHGYGGPINWLLSLKLWKLPARLSYAMYIMHFSLMVIFNSSNTAPIYFTVPYILFLFCGFFVITFVVAIVVTVLIDMPFSILFKLLLDKGKKSAKSGERNLSKCGPILQTMKQDVSNNGVQKFD